jgi:putative cobalt transporter subunit CbtA
MVGSLLLRGLVVGLAAGLLAGGFGFAFGEPRVDRAIAYEEAHAAVGDAGEPAPVSRDGQKGGLFLAMSLYGLSVGGLFALAFAFARGRFGPAAAWPLATRLGATLFVAVVLVPFLKYPANPPSIGDPSTISERTWLYLVMVAICLLALLAGARVGRGLAGGRPPWAAPLAAAATFVFTVGLAGLVLPGVDEVPAGFPADLLWEFRLASLGTQAVFWSALAAGFGIVTHRAAARRGG